MANSDVIQCQSLVTNSLHKQCCPTKGKLKRRHEDELQDELSTDKTIVQDDSPRKKKTFSLNELDSIRLARTRGLSHWPHSTPSAEMMWSNGWFSCNVGDRVICIYCNTICHGWKDDDDPAEVHARLAPQCPFVLSLPVSHQSPPIVNDTIGLSALPRHSSMSELPRRHASFAESIWTQTTPSVDELVRAGFFFSGTGTAVTCFFCGGSLQNWGVNDNPLVEHARWFPSCLYAKQLCGDRLHAKIQLSKKQTSQKKIDEISLTRLVAARLDLPAVQRLLPLYRLPIIKRCIEDQLRIKQDDFVSDTDLSIACLILQKQIDIIQGNKDTLIVPSQSRVTAIPSISSNSKSSECVVCLSEDRQLACIPCGHLCACVPCGYALRTCPVCRQKIQSFIRIYC